MRNQRFSPFVPYKTGNEYLLDQKLNKVHLIAQLLYIRLCALSSKSDTAGHFLQEDGSPMLRSQIREAIGWEGNAFYKYFNELRKIGYIQQAPFGGFYIVRMIYFKANYDQKIKEEKETQIIIEDKGIPENKQVVINFFQENQIINPVQNAIYFFDTMSKENWAPNGKKIKDWRGVALAIFNAGVLLQ